MEFTTIPPTQPGFHWIVRGSRTAIAAITDLKRLINGEPELPPTQCGDWHISVAECVLVGRQKVLRIRVVGDRERRIDDPKLGVLLWGPRVPWSSSDLNWSKLTKQVNAICEPESSPPRR